MISWVWNWGLFVVLLFLLFFISSGILRAQVVIKERITILKVPPCRDQIITMRQFRIESEEVRIQQSLFH